MASQLKAFRRQLPVLNDPNVKPMAAATLFNAAGNNIYTVALGWLAFEMTGSPLVVGAVLGFLSLPLVFMSFVSGAVNDRVHRPTVLRLYSLYYTLLSCGFTAILFLGQVTVAHMLGYMFLVGIGFSFGPTARRAIYADSVSRERLVDALAVDGTAFELGHLVMPAIIGIVLATFGAGYAFAIQLGLYTVMTILVFRVKTDRTETGPRRRTPFLASIVEGLSYAKSQPGVLRMLVLSTVISLIGADFVFILIPVMSGEVFGAGAAGVGVIMAGGAAGGLLGPIALLAGRKFLGSHSLLVGSIALMAIAMVAFALSPSLGIGVVLFGLVGVTQPVFRATSEGFLQLAISSKYRGRIASLNQISRGLRVLGGFVAGGVAQMIGVEAAIIVAGIIVLGVSILCWLAFRSIPVEGW